VSASTTARPTHNVAALPTIIALPRIFLTILLLLVASL
jgi:hypothetical protein